MGQVAIAREHIRSAPRWRSLRFNVVAIAIAVVCFPLVFAFAWGLVERRVEADLRSNVVGAADDMRAVWARSGADTPDRVEPAWQDIAARRGVRVRLVSAKGEVLAEVDRQPRSDPVHALATIVFGDDGAPSMDAFDASLGPVGLRPEVRDVIGGAHVVTGCRTSFGSKLVACHAARRVEGFGDGVQVLHVQETSRRALRPFYDLRHLILRVVALAFPCLLVLAFVLASRVARPIEALRDEALLRSAKPEPGGALTSGGPAEVEDLRAAFNELLAKLDERRRHDQRFVADLVHELKSPMATIRACGEMLADRSPTDERVARVGSALTEATGRIDRLVTQLLELTRAEVGMPGEEQREVDLAALARGVADSCRLRHPAVRFSVHGDSPVNVRGVPSRIESLLRNLVDNAASFAARDHDSGTSGRVCIDVAWEDGTAVMRVEDDGPGIAPEDMPRIFDRFFTTRRAEHGVGLGLSLAKAIAEAHGGTLKASSTPGRGAVFEVRLPRSGRHP